MKLLITLFLAIFMAFSSAANPGVQISVSTAGVNYVMKQMIPVVEAALKDIHAEGTSGTASGFKYSISNIRCPAIRIGGASAAFTPPSSVALSLTGFGGECKASWSFKLKIWPHIPKGSGSVTIGFDNTNANVAIALGVNNGRPRVTAGSAAVNIGGLKIKFSGGIVSAILNLFKGAISNTIKKKMNQVIGPVMNNFVNNQLNSILSKLTIIRALPLRAPYNIASIRYGLTAAPTSGGTFIGIPFQGDIVKTSNPVNPPIPPSTLPPFTAVSGSYYMEFKLSAYTLLSAAHTFVSAGLVKDEVPSAKIPLGFGNTNGYALVAPGLVSAHPNKPVNILFSSNTLPTLKFTGGTVIDVELPATAQFNVVGASTNPAFILDAKVALTLSLTVTKSSAGVPIALSPKLNYVGVSIKVSESSVGTVSFEPLVELVNYLLKDVLVPTANEIIAPGIPFPELPGFKLTNFDLKFVNDYISLGTNFEFNPVFLTEFAEVIEKGRLIDEAMKNAEINGGEYKALRVQRA